MYKKKSVRSQSSIGRFGYSNSILETQTISAPHVVKTTGTGIAQESIIPIASLFSSMDFIQPSTTMKKSPSPHTPLRRAKTSFYRTEQEQHEQPIM